VAFGPPAAKSWQRACLVTLLPFNDFFSVAFAGKKQPKQVGKMPEIRKQLTQKWWQYFLKYFGKINKFWSLGLDFQVSSLRIFDEVSVSISKIYRGLGLEGYRLDNITTI